MNTIRFPMSAAVATTPALMASDTLHDAAASPLARWMGRHPAWLAVSALGQFAGTAAPPPEAERYIVGFSGGKDSIACVLHLLESGVSRHKIELWHHLIDPPGKPFMDWPCTSAYCVAFAEALGLPILFQHREGGFEREMLRDGTPTAPVAFQTPDGGTIRAGGKGPPGTRKRFPQVSADLTVRWCSAYLKIDVAARAITNDPRFAQGTFVLVTGERAEESPNRARYPELAPHRTSTRTRYVMHWLPVHKWPEAQVWAIMQRWGVVPHPAYVLGFGRVSCMRCIFGNPDQWATVRDLDPAGFNKVANYERQFGTTIQRKLSVEQLADKGRTFIPQGFGRLAAESQTERFSGPILVLPNQWTLPAGAFKHDGGPV